MRNKINSHSSTVRLENIYTFGFFIQRTMNTLDKTLNLLIKKKGIDLQTSQLIILRYLYVLEGMTKSEISNIIDKDVATVSRTIDLLEKKGYVRKEKKNSQEIGIFLTKKSYEIKLQLHEVLEEIRSLGLEGFNDEEKIKGIEFLNRLYSNVKDGYLKLLEN